MNTFLPSHIITSFLLVIHNLRQFVACNILTQFAPSLKGGKQISEIQILLTKMAMLRSGKIALLTYDEVDCINLAIKAFVTQLRAKIPASQHRDDIIESCEKLQSYIVATFLPAQA